MPLYEVLLKRDGREELRLTDRPYNVDETVQISNRTWVVTEVRRAGSGKPGGFVLEPAPISVESVP